MTQGKYFTTIERVASKPPKPEKVEFCLSEYIPKGSYYKEADSQSRAEVARLRLKWVDTEVYVHLPESGNFYYKPKGSDTLALYGNWL